MGTPPMRSTRGTQYEFVSVIDDYDGILRMSSRCKYDTHDCVIYMCMLARGYIIKTLRNSVLVYSSHSSTCRRGGNVSRVFNTIFLCVANTVSCFTRMG